MDQKLARGLTRDLFRRLAELSSLETRPTTPAIAEILQTYLLDGGVDEASLAALVSRLQQVFASVGDIIVETRRIRGQVRRLAFHHFARPCVGNPYRHRNRGQIRADRYGRISSLQHIPELKDAPVATIGDATAILSA